MNNITPEEANDLIKKGEANVIDVRTKEEFVSGHIGGAKNIDFNSPQFEEELKKLDKHKCYIVNCQSGGRSSKATARMENLDFSNANLLLGGLSAWENSGLQTEK